MGLDTVELVIRIEKHFDIAIPDGEAAKIVTVQDLADCVYTRITVNPTTKCRSQILFYRIRNYFVDYQFWERDDITPDLKIRELIDASPAGAWPELQEHLRLFLPSLSKSSLSTQPQGWISIMGIQIPMNQRRGVTDGTMRDLVEWMLAQNHEALIDPRRLFNKHDIERIVIGIVSDSAGIPVNEIKLEHKICDDLGLD